MNSSSRTTFLPSFWKQHNQNYYKKGPSRHNIEKTFPRPTILKYISTQYVLKSAKVPIKNLKTLGFQFATRLMVQKFCWHLRANRVSTPIFSNKIFLPLCPWLDLDMHLALNWPPTKTHPVTVGSFVEAQLPQNSQPHFGYCPQRPSFFLVTLKVTLNTSYNNWGAILLVSSLFHNIVTC